MDLYRRVFSTSQIEQRLTMTLLVEFTTDFGTFLVTPEDRTALINDLGAFGTCAYTTSINADGRAVAKRVDLRDVSDEQLPTEK